TRNRLCATTFIPMRRVRESSPKIFGVSWNRSLATLRLSDPERPRDEDCETNNRFTMNRLGALLLCLIGMAHSPAIHAARNDSSRMKTIFVFGDSLSDGFQLKRSQAYPALLLDKLRAAGLDFEVANASQSGGTTTSGIARLPPHLKRNSDSRREQRIDIFILELGINDAFLGTPVDQIE